MIWRGRELVLRGDEPLGMERDALCPRGLGLELVAWSVFLELIVAGNRRFYALKEKLTFVSIPDEDDILATVVEAEASKDN
jgi:hypothetical protein